MLTWDLGLKAIVYAARSGPNSLLGYLLEHSPPAITITISSKSQGWTLRHLHGQSLNGSSESLLNHLLCIAPWVTSPLCYPCWQFWLYSIIRTNNGINIEDIDSISCYFFLNWLSYQVRLNDLSWKLDKFLTEKCCLSVQKALKIHEKSIQIYFSLENLWSILRYLAIAISHCIAYKMTFILSHKQHFFFTATWWYNLFLKMF